MSEPRVPPHVEALLRRAYAAFNARDVEAVIALMHPDVDWPNAWEGGRVHGHAAVRDYWARQFEVIDARVEPVDFALDPDGRVVVDVHQVVRDRRGALLSDGHVQHVYRVRDGLVEHMEVREP
jgi:ketosteroid isomerase-like protein